MRGHQGCPGPSRQGRVRLDTAWPGKRSLSGPSDSAVRTGWCVSLQESLARVRSQEHRLDPSAQQCLWDSWEGERRSTALGGVRPQEKARVEAPE